MSKKVVLFILLSAAALIAWQPAPALLLTVSAEPAVPVRGDPLTLTFVVENRSAEPLERVVVVVHVPSDTSLQEARVPNEDWRATTLPEGEVWYTALAPLPPGEPARLVMALEVDVGAGDAISIVSYSAFASGLEEAVTGAPVTLRIDGAPTSQPTVLTSTPSPQAEPATATPTSEATPTPSITPAATGTPVPPPSPTPSPTITVVMVQLAPTPTPNLNSEQQELGALTVSIFVGFTLLIAVLGAVWLIRSVRR